MADKCREVKNILSAFCNKEMTREKSVRKQGKSKHRRLKIRYRKVKPT